MSQNKNKNLLLISIITVFVLIFCIVMFAHVKRFTSIVNGIINQFFAHSANEQVQMVNSVFDNRIDLLTNITHNLLLHEHNNTVLTEHLNKSISSSTFILLVDKAGNIITKTGNIDSSEVQNITSALSGNISIKKINKSKYNNEAQFIFTVPFPENSEKLKTLVCGYSAEKMYDLLNMESFGGSAYSYIYDSQGNIIIDAKNKLSLSGEVINFFDHIEILDKNSHNILPQIISDFKEGKKGFFTISFDKEKRALIYNPLGINDWIIVDIMNIAIIDEQIKKITRIGVILVIVGLICIIFPIIFIILYNKKYLHQIQSDQDVLKADEERLSLALENSELAIWDYDFKTKSIIQTKHSLEIYNLGKIIPDVPNYFIENKIIHPDSVSDYLGIYEKLSNGDEKVEAIIKMQTKDKKGYRYEYVRYKNMFDSLGNPYRAIGISEDVTEEQELLNKYQMEMDSHKALFKDVYLSVVLNITQKTITEMKCVDGFEKDKLELAPFVIIFKLIAGRVIKGDEARLYFKNFTPESITRFLNNGETTLSFDYLRQNAERKEVWMSFDAHFLFDPTNKDVIAFFYLKSIDGRKRLEIELKMLSQEDALTKILNRAGLTEGTNNLFNGYGAGSQHAFIIVDIDNFKSVNDTFGHKTGDQVLIDISKQLHFLLRSDDIFGRIGGDEFVICLKDIPSCEIIEQKAKTICQAIKKNIGESVAISASIGIAMYPLDGNNFQELYEKADLALYWSKENGKDRYSFFDKTMYKNTD